MGDLGQDSPPLELPASTLELLDQFYAEEAAQADRMREVETLSAAPADAEATDAVRKRVVMGVDEFRRTFGESWQLSQFWYSEAFSERLARQLHALLDECGPNARIAFVSCPTAYVAFQHLYDRAHDTYLFEYDSRFELIAAEQFVKYDFNDSGAVPEALLGTIDVLVLDPPFLNVATNQGFSDSAARLVRRDAAGRVTGRVLLLTGCSIGDEAARIYGALDQREAPARGCQGGALQRTALEVEHAGGLANAFGAWGNWPGANAWGT